MPDAAAPQPIQRKDYRPPDYLIDRVDLMVDLAEAHARVRARLAMRRNPDAGGAAPPLVLHGRKLELAALLVDDRPLAETEYTVDTEHLTVAVVPADKFVVNV